MLGSFPPSKKRWCIDFFYPNFNNDMWRIWGLLCFADKNHFVDVENQCFRQEDIVSFLTEKGIALYDTAVSVVRTRNTASDKDLEVVAATDIAALLARLPLCTAIAATGQKAAELLALHFGVSQPAVGTSVAFQYGGRSISFYRMPSSSRAYPLPLEAKASQYAVLLRLLDLASPF